MPSSTASPLVGARVLVVGTGKMGVATASAALAVGAKVVLSGRSAERLAGVARAVPDLSTLVADPEDARQAVDLVEQVEPDHIAVLAGAGHISAARGIADTELPEAVASFGRFWLSYNLLRAAAGRVGAGGSVTLLSGSSSNRPSEGRGFWGSLHGSIEALGRNAAYELSPLRVNTISPGGIGVVPMNRQLVDHPGRPEDIASMVLALMSNPAVTATVVDVDGGEFLGTFE
jgi:NAD(P)-dependent dehydrogenase (short-subunit alcohol dehydrogenase family)